MNVRLSWAALFGAAEAAAAVMPTAWAYDVLMVVIGAGALVGPGAAILACGVITLFAGRSRGPQRLNC